MAQETKIICDSCGKESVEHPFATLNFCNSRFGSQSLDICNDCLARIHSDIPQLIRGEKRTLVR